MSASSESTADQGPVAEEPFDQEAGRPASVQPTYSAGAQVVNLAAVSVELLAEAAETGRAVRKLVARRDQSLTVVLVALTAGNEMIEHDNPGEATVQVVRGRISVDFVGANAEWTMAGGSLARLPQTPHSLYAHEDSSVLLTYVPRARLN